MLHSATDTRAILRYLASGGTILKCPARTRADQARAKLAKRIKPSAATRRDYAIRLRAAESRATH